MEIPAKYLFTCQILQNDNDADSGCCISRLLVVILFNNKKQKSRMHKNSMAFRQSGLYIDSSSKETLCPFEVKKINYKVVYIN